MSLFNRPAWATSSVQKENDGDGSDLFSHSRRSHQEIVAEQERRRREKREKEERKKKDHDERKGFPKHEDKAAVNNSTPKRRRITSEDSAVLLNSIGLTPTTAPNEKSEKVVYNDEAIDMPVRRSPRITRQVDNSRSVVSLESEPRKMSVPEKRKSEGEVQILGATTVDEEQLVGEESDDEFAELAHEARKRRQQKLEDTQVEIPLIAEESSSTVDTSRRERDEHQLPEPVITIFISSQIPNTQPLIVKRKLSQRIQEIREAWCAKQGFTKEFSKDVFFIHRLHRVYDVTTCRSLGLDVDVFGNITMRGAEGKEGVEKVHLEAVTDGIYQQLRDEKSRAAQKRSGQIESDEAEDADSHANAEHAKGESLIRIVLKAKDKEDFKLKVRPTTRFSKIMAAYSKTHAPECSVFLEFDGERLNPDDEVQNTDVSDMDCIDVHIN